MGDLAVHVASAEDTVISKLEWAATGESERQFRDAMGVIAIQGQANDRSYVAMWVGELGLEALWSRALSAAEGDER